MQPPEISAIDIQMSGLVKAFQLILNMRQDALQCFCDQGVQVEGWLKGEVLLWLTREKASGIIQEFDREVVPGVGRKKVDIRLTLASQGGMADVWLELKHYLIGFQRGVPYEARTYFSDSKYGIITDITKLATINTTYRYILVLATTAQIIALPVRSAVAEGRGGQTGCRSHPHRRTPRPPSNLVIRYRRDRPVLAHPGYSRSAMLRRATSARRFLRSYHLSCERR
jgi:hypothetical protein